jgi:hypothetical protein
VISHGFSHGLPEDMWRPFPENGAEPRPAQVNDRTTTSRQQLRVYVVREKEPTDRAMDVHIGIYKLYIYIQIIVYIYCIYIYTYTFIQFIFDFKRHLKRHVQA